MLGFAFTRRRIHSRKCMYMPQLYSHIASCYEYQAPGLNVVKAFGSFLRCSKRDTKMKVENILKKSINVLFEKKEKGSDSQSPADS